MNENDQTPREPLPLPPPPNIGPLQYQTPEKNPVYKTRTPFGIQMLAGFVAWISGIGFLIMAANRSLPSYVSLNGSITIWGLVGIVLVGLGALAVWLNLRFRWRGFFPGLLIGIAMTCLIPIGIIAVVCGWRH